VLRLKGGDPFMFGRGAEEGEALAATGIRFRIVPGVTAGIGGLAYAGIPVTHRAINSAVTFVTGHGHGGAASADWEALAPLPVLVVYMGLRALASIAVRLIAAGKDAGTPVAIVSDATTARQRVIVTTLGAASLDVRRQRAEAPAIIVIGRVVELRAVLDWFTAEAAPASSIRAEAHRLTGAVS
jgi:uroporphyrin-III C-methyltransferase